MPTLQSRSAFGGQGGRFVGITPNAPPRRNPHEFSHEPPARHPHQAFSPKGGNHNSSSEGGGEKPKFSEKFSSSSKESREAAPAAERPAAAPAATTSGGGGASDYRDAFKASKTYSSSGSAAKKDESSSSMGAGASRFRAAVEAEKWRSKLSSGDDKKSSSSADKLDSYRQQTQSDWMRERLLGPDDADDEGGEQEDHEVALRARKVVAQAWEASTHAWVETAAIDRLEETLRRRLGELESTAAYAGRVARAFFVECDPQRSGRVLQSCFGEAMARKLNFDFPARGSMPSSRDVLDALYMRYDLNKSSAITADDFHAALVGASRPGRASGRVINTIGRMREGLERCGGGYDALLRTSRWLDQMQAKDRKNTPPGCVACSTFIEGLQKLADRAAVMVSEADLVTLCDAFEPPLDISDGSGGGGRADDPLVAYDEFVLAVRGPPMTGARLGVVKAAYAALKEDAKSKAVKPEQIAMRFGTHRHPAVQAGAMEEKEAALATIGVWRDSAGDEVTKAEFCERYEWISPLFMDDDDFIDMMKAAWNLK